MSSSKNKSRHRQKKYVACYTFLRGEALDTSKYMKHQDFPPFIRNKD